MQVSLRLWQDSAERKKSDDCKRPAKQAGEGEDELKQKTQEEVSKKGIERQGRVLKIEDLRIKVDSKLDRRRRTHHTSYHSPEDVKLNEPAR